MLEHAVYIRVKRRNQTFCLLCDEGDTILQVKRRVLAALAQHAEGDRSAGTPLPQDPAALQLLLPRPDPPQADGGDGDDDEHEFEAPEYLNDASKLSDLNIKEDAILHVVLPVADNEWEAVDVVPTAALD